MNRLLFSLYAFVFIALISLGWAIDTLYQQYSDQNAPTFVQSEQIITTFTRYLDAKPSLEASMPLPPLFQIEALDQFILPNELLTQLNRGEIVILNSDEGITLHQLLSSKPFVLSLGPLMGQTQNEAVWQNYIFTALFYGGIGFILWFWFRPLLLAVLQLSQALKKIAAGALSTRLNNTSIYLNELYVEFNDMAEQLEILNEDNQLFSQAVSHDIRTPLSRILFAIEKLKQSNDQNALDVAKTIENDVQSIESLSKELLDYARLGKTKSVQQQAINIKILAEQVIAGFEHESKLITLETGVNNESLALDADLIQKILNNLVSNAIRFCATKVLVSLSLNNGCLNVSVEDDGKGLDLTQKTLADYCQPFVQHKRADKHFGVGLALVARAVKLMGGELSVENNHRLSGARFCVMIPIKK